MFSGSQQALENQLLHKQWNSPGLWENCLTYTCVEALDKKLTKTTLLWSFMLWFIVPKSWCVVWKLLEQEVFRSSVKLLCGNNKPRRVWTNNETFPGYETRNWLSTPFSVSQKPKPAQISTTKSKHTPLSFPARMEQYFNLLGNQNFGLGNWPHIYLNLLTCFSIFLIPDMKSPIWAASWFYYRKWSWLNILYDIGGENTGQ